MEVEQTGIITKHCKNHKLALVKDVFAAGELKQRQRRRQQERHKFTYLVGKNNSFARPARAFFAVVHSFAFVSQTAT